MSIAGVCLKARPTLAQLADRLRPIDGVWPDGVELYLAAEDLRDVDAVARRIACCAVPDGFAWLIEGPVDSLDGGDFDVTRVGEADRVVVRRLAELAGRIGALAVNIHVIAPGEDVGRLSLFMHDELLRRSVPFLREFVDVVSEAGAVPTVENMPPVLRMRRGGFSFTPIGMASQDLLWLVDQVPGLKILPDTSHAGLYLNARWQARSTRLQGEKSTMGERTATSGPSPTGGLDTSRSHKKGEAPAWLGTETGDPSPPGGLESFRSHKEGEDSVGLGPRFANASGGPSPTGGLDGSRRHNKGEDAVWLGPLLGYLGQLPPEPADVLGYVQRFEGHIANAQVSDAAGLLGEGLAYGAGEVDLDPVIAWLGQHASYLVTETLEASNDDAVNMREALRRMRAVLG